jgi:capsular exopolysaccharide synthesis family protein
MSHDLQPIVPPDDGQFPEPVASYFPDRFSGAAALHLRFQRCWTALRKRWWVVVLCLLFIGGPAVTYAIHKPPAFRSEAIMWLTSKLSLPGSAGFYSEEMSSYMGTQAELMKSPAIQQRAFQKVRAAFPEVALLVTNPQPEILPFALTIISSPKNSVLKLEAKGRFPQATRAFLDAVMEEYLDLKKGAYQQTSVGALAGITDQIKEAEKQMKAQQEQLTAFGRSNNISYLTEHGLSAGSHLSRLEGLLSDLRTEHRLLESITPEQFLDASTGDRNALSETTLPVEKAPRAAEAAMEASGTAYYQALQQVELLKATRDEFARVLRPSHSKMVKLNQQVSGLEQVLKTIKENGGQRALAQIANRKKSLELQIESLETQYRAWETNAIEASGKLAEHERMKEDLQHSQALYDRLVGLLQTVDLNKSLDREPLSPLAPASVARPAGSALKLAAAGIFLAFSAALGLLILLESLDDRFISVTELSCHFPEEVVGQIPETRLRLINGSSRRPRLASQQNAFTESFRSLRSSLFFMFDESPPPRVVLLTSAVPKEGKSTVAAHLAASLAVSGSRVLLVDADLRRSSLHQIFGVALKPGLREVLTKGLPAATAIVPVRLPPALAAESGGPDASSSARLFLLPGGEAGPGTAEILLGSQVNELLRDLAAQYDYVIIDSPPVLATDDAMGLATKVDGVFMVVRASYTDSRMVWDALDRLNKRHVKILGLVYNRAAPSADYYYRYRRDYQTAT